MATLITLPASFPGWDAGATIAPVDLFASVPMSTGATRRRRVYRADKAPKDIDLSANLSEAQVLAFDAWFENSIQAGRLRFLTFIPHPTAAWYEASFTGPYSATAQTAGYWTLSCRLRLHEAGAPGTPALSLSITVSLQTTADIAQPLDLSMDILAGLITGVAN